MADKEKRPPTIFLLLVGMVFWCAAGILTAKASFAYESEVKDSSSKTEYTYQELKNLNRLHWKAGGIWVAQILGHESLNTTAIYTKNSMEQLAEATEGLTY